MWSSRQRAMAGRLFLRRIGLAMLLGLTLFGAWGVWQAYQKERESALMRISAESQRADLEVRKQELSADIDMLQTDRGKEEALRTQYALAERGERLIVIVDPSTTTPIQATSTTIGSWFRKTFWPW